MRAIPRDCVSLSHAIVTGPGGSVSIGANGVVGNKAWVTGGNSGVQAGYVTDDMNVEFPDVPKPTAVWFTPIGGFLDLTTYKYLIAISGNYRLDTLSMQNNDTLRITTNSTVTLYVSGNVSLSGQASIQIDPGASLKIYVGTASATPTTSASIGGQGVVNNNASAANFYYYGLPSNASLSLSGNAAFTGVINAPSADFTLGGGGNNTYDFVGASITKSVSLNGHYNFHYDESLQRSGPVR